MLIYLYGPDSYRRIVRLNEILNNYRTKHSSPDLLVADLEDDPEAWKSVREFIRQPSFFAPSKTVVVKESGSVEEKEWIRLLKESRDEENTFFIISDREKPKKNFSFLLKEAAQKEEFEELEGKNLESFVLKEAKERSLFFSEGALRFFISFLESEKSRSWTVVRELDKIALLGFPNPLSLENLQAVIAYTRKLNFFSHTREFLFGRTVPEKMKILEELFLQNEPAAYLFNLLAYQARGRHAEILADYDVALKAGTLEYEEILLDFALR